MDEENKYETLSLTFAKDELPLLNKFKQYAAQKDWSLNKAAKNLMKIGLNK